MTICIGILCDNGQAVVAVSDKLVTGPNIEFEHTQEKIIKLNEYCVALSAGSALRHVELYNRVKRSMNEIEKPTISNISELVKKHYIELRNSCFEELILKPRSLNLVEFYHTMRNFPDGFASFIERLNNEFTYQITVLVCGVDNIGGHIYIVGNPGVAEVFDSIGCAAIGIGAQHAHISLISNRCFQNTPLKQAIYFAMEAKICSEIAPGVGKDTDMLIVKKDKITGINEDVIKNLRIIFEEKINPEYRKGVVKRIEEIDFGGVI